MTTEQYVRTRTIAAPPEQIFAVLADPDQHQNTEPGDWVRSALDAEPITEVGQIFAVEMYLDFAGGRYEMHNKVSAFEQNRTIAWMPGQVESGNWVPGRWWWRYDLAPVEDGTEVTLTYDWSDVPAEAREQFGGMPVFEVGFIDSSLEALDRHITG